MTDATHVVPLESITMNDVSSVGGKNASLGEMLGNLTKLGVKVPGGFATTADAYREFLSFNKLDSLIANKLKDLDVGNVEQLANTGKEIRSIILQGKFPEKLEQAIRTSFEKLTANQNSEFSVAVRSSATAEDLPEASFAGQQDTILNVKGIDNLLTSIREVFASLFTDRAISYREHYGFEHMDVALSACIQKMVRSDISSSGVVFTIDTESGFDGVVFVTSSYGLGELVVQGVVNPDEFYVEKRALENNNESIVCKHLGRKQQTMVYHDEHSKKVETIETPQEKRDQFSLSDEEITNLARFALLIEKHYKKSMDVEWAKDGNDGEIYIVQARPETVKSRSSQINLEKYSLKEKGEVLIKGRSVGHKIGAGVARVIPGVAEINLFKAGEVLVTDMTDPDWEPIMKKAAAIVTNKGGRTCHAAIVARELGIPAVVGCFEATNNIKTGDEVTVSCVEGDEGFVYKGILKYERTVDDLKSLPDLDVKIMMNIGNPSQAFQVQQIPNHGVGLARLEFIINQNIGIHPQACLDYENLDPELKATIKDKIKGYKTPVDYYRDKLTEGIATLAASFYPKPIIVRLSDFKSNEYANLIGGKAYEPSEENPMIGFRGAGRYIAKSFEKSFELECDAVKKVRNDHGLTNVEILIPFVRTIPDAKDIIKQLEKNGLKRGENGLKVIMMCEIPSNAICAEEFLEIFDGFSIGSNDLTQLTLGIDRDSEIIADSFNEQDPAVLALLDKVISVCNKAGKYIGICGQGPSDHPEFADWLLKRNIGSISLTPDSVLSTWKFLAEHVK